MVAITDSLFYIGLLNVYIFYDVHLILMLLNKFYFYLTMNNSMKTEKSNSDVLVTIDSYVHINMFMHVVS